MIIHLLKTWAKVAFALLFLLPVSFQSVAADNPFSSLEDLGDSLGGGSDEPLDPDVAFVLSTKSENGQIIANWQSSSRPSGSD